MGARYRVWIVRYEGYRPAAWCDVPSGATAVEPAERRPMTVRQARRYVEAFNRAVAGGPRKIWAVALPVRIRYLGDAEPGRTLRQHAGIGLPAPRCRPLDDAVGLGSGGYFVSCVLP